MLQRLPLVTDWRPPLLPILLSWFTATVSAALPPPRTPGEVPPDTVLARVERLVRAGKADTALALVRPLVELAVASGDTDMEKNARLHEASALCILGRSREGAAASRHALRLARATGDSARGRMATRWLAYSLLGQGRQAEATALYRDLRDASLAANDVREEAYARMGLAYFALQDGDSRAAADGYARAATLFARTGETVMELEAMVGLARSFALAGRYDQMRQLYLDILRRGGSTGVRRVESFALNNLAVHESQAGDPGRAMEYWARAVQYLNETGDLRSIVMPSLNLVAARLELGEFDEAERELAELSARCEQQGYLALQAAVLNQLGAVRAAQGRPQAAAQTWQSVLERADVPLDERAGAAQHLARELNANARHDAALALLDAETRAFWPRLAPSWRGELSLERAAALAGLNRDTEVLVATAEVLGLAREGGFRQLGMRALLLQARSELTLGVPDSALAHLLQAQRLWDELRAVPRDPRWREQRGALGGEIHVELARLLLRYPRSSPVAERRRAAFDMLQHYKARTLLERMLGPDVFHSGHPAARSAVTLAELQSDALLEGDLLLDFYLGETGSLLIAVDRDSCAVLPLAPRARLAVLANLYVSFLTGAATSARDRVGAPEVDRASRRLGQELLGPASELVERSRRVILSLDGLLNGLPVEQLPLPTADGAATLTTQPRLGDRSAFRVPSASVLSFLRAGGRASPAQTPRGVLALAGDAAPGEQRLPGAAAEVAWLARRFRDVAVGDDLCPGTDGAELVALCAGRQVLHVAAHTEAFDQRPWNSRVWVGIGDDGKPCALDAAHIASMPLGVRLAVISGCESAGGRLLAGEGVLGLTGAFLSAGAAVTVVSLWPVDDVATFRLMRPFYRELARGRPVADALRRAQAELRRGGETSHPFYWAGFVVVGDGEISIKLQRRPTDIVVKWGVGALAVLAFGMGGAALRRRRWLVIIRR